MQVTAAKLREDSERLLEQAGAQLIIGVKPALLVREGFPDKEFAAAALDWHADLLVMGTHGRTGLAHMFKGSVADSVLHHAPCPVLVGKIGKCRGFVHSRNTRTRASRSRQWQYGRHQRC